MTSKQHCFSYVVTYVTYVSYVTSLMAVTLRTLRTLRTCKLRFTRKRSAAECLATVREPVCVGGVRIH